MWDHLEPEGIAMVHAWTRAFTCLNPSCDCLYYSLWRMVPARYCNKPLGFKSNAPSPRPICYCLGFTLEDIRRDAGREGNGSVVRSIREHAAQNSGLCERLNPSGQCCWGQVRRYLDGSSGPSGRV